MACISRRGSACVPCATSANVELIGFNECQLPCKEKTQPAAAEREREAAKRALSRAAGRQREHNRQAGSMCAPCLALVVVVVVVY